MDRYFKITSGNNTEVYDPIILLIALLIVI